MVVIDGIVVPPPPPDDTDDDEEEEEKEEKVETAPPPPPPPVDADNNRKPTKFGNTLEMMAQSHMASIPTTRAPPTHEKCQHLPAPARCALLAALRLRTISSPAPPMAIKRSQEQATIRGKAPPSPVAKSSLAKARPGALARAQRRGRGGAAPPRRRRLTESLISRPTRRKRRRPTKTATLRAELFRRRRCFGCV